MTAQRPPAAAGDVVLSTHGLKIALASILLLAVLSIQGGGHEVLQALSRRAGWVPMRAKPLAPAGVPPAGGAPPPGGYWPEDDTAIFLEDRGSVRYMWHWFYLTIGTLLHDFPPIPGRTRVVYMPWLHDNDKGKVQEYHNTTIEMMKPEYRIVAGDVPQGVGFVGSYGLPLWHNDRVLPEEVHADFRDFFTRKLAQQGPLPTPDPKLLVYITRKGQEQLHGDGKGGHEGGKRQITNEADFLPQLDALGFQRVQLEQYSMADKIKLFMRARMVVTPQSAALTFMPFGDKKTADVVEIYPAADFLCHYCYGARALGMNWARFTGVTTQGQPVSEQFGNSEFSMTVDVPALIEFVKQRLATPPEQLPRVERCHKDGDD